MSAIQLISLCLIALSVVGSIVAVRHIIAIKQGNETFVDGKVKVVCRNLRYIVWGTSSLIFVLSCSFLFMDLSPDHRIVQVAIAIPALMTPAKKILDKDTSCLASNVYYESRGEPIIGQILVAAVTLNRVQDPRFPSNICAVVWQQGQFSWTSENKSSHKEQEAWYQATVIARIMILTYSLVDVHDYFPALYFFNPHKAALNTKKWARNSKRFWLSVDNHDFYADINSANVKYRTLVSVGESNKY